MERSVIKKQHFPNLDATRFVAFIPVFLTHCFFTSDAQIRRSVVYRFFETHVKIGLIGLDYFFVLSSFLITWIILEEFGNTGKFNIWKFWIRRCLRIWPLYFLVVILGFSWYYFSNSIEPGSTEQLPPWYHFVFFTLNFYSVKHGIAFLFFLTIFWSVSIEEQFYLFWALLLRFARKYFTEFCISLIILSLLFRLMVKDDNGSLVFHTFSALGNFSTGAMVAYGLYNRNSFYRFITGIKKSISISIYLLFFLCIIFYSSLFSSGIGMIFERLVFALFYGFLVADQAFNPRTLFKAGTYEQLSKLGIISFGLYCYHGIVITLMSKLAGIYGYDRQDWLVFFLNPLIAFVLTIFLAMLSYHFFEKKILKLKYKFY